MSDQKVTVPWRVGPLEMSVEAGDELRRIFPGHHHRGNRANDFIPRVSVEERRNTSVEQPDVHGHYHNESSQTGLSDVFCCRIEGGY